MVVAIAAGVTFEKLQFFWHQMCGNGRTHKQQQA